MDWNPDDIVLTIDAFQRIERAPDSKASIIQALAGELRREVKATEAAIEAVGVERMQSRVAAALINVLREDQSETQRLAAAIRELRGQRSSGGAHGEAP